MGTTKEEMKPSTDDRKVKTINAADTVGKKGGFLSKMRDKLSKTAPQKVAQTYADLVEDFQERLEAALKTSNFDGFANDTKMLIDRIDVRLRDMVVNKRKEVNDERGREDYNQRALARLNAMDYHWVSIQQILRNPDNLKNATELMKLEYVNFHIEEIGRLTVEYTDDK